MIPIALLRRSLGSEAGWRSELGQMHAMRRCLRRGSNRCCSEHRTRASTPQRMSPTSPLQLSRQDTRRGASLRSPSLLYPKCGLYLVGRATKALGPLSVLRPCAGTALRPLPRAHGPTLRPQIHLQARIGFVHRYNSMRNAMGRSAIKSDGDSFHAGTPFLRRGPRLSSSRPRATSPATTRRKPGNPSRTTVPCLTRLDTAAFWPQPSPRWQSWPLFKR